MLEQKKDWWRGGTIYQIYPRSFADSNNDGVGDLPGIVERLPHIASLGVDSIWISPFFRSPMKDYGYDVSDYCDVDPLFGTLEDFDALIARSHELGLKVMIDQVLSHSSDQHLWFQESRKSRDNPYADWYVWADALPDGSAPNNWLSVFGGTAWQWEPRRAQYFLHNFLPSQPDLNFHNPAVQEQMLAVVRFWCERGVDGFRFDACNYHFHDRMLRSNPPLAPKKDDALTVRRSNPYGMQWHLFDRTQAENLEFLERMRALMNEYGVASVGEIGDDDVRIIAEYTSKGNKLHMAYSFPFLTPEFSAKYIRQQVELLENSFADDSGWGCWAISNHDAPRVVTRWGVHAKSPEDQARFAKLMLAMLGTLRGSFCVYQGEELGLEEAEVPFERLHDPYGKTFWPEFKGRDGCRTPMPWEGSKPWGGFSTHEPWLPVPASHCAKAVDRQENDPHSVLNFFRTYLKWRRTQPALLTGEIEFLDAPADVLLFVRSLGEDKILAAFNLSSVVAEFQLPLKVDPLQGHGLTGNQLGVVEAKGKLLLPAWGGFIARCA